MYPAFLLHESNVSTLTSLCLPLPNHEKAFFSSEFSSCWGRMKSFPFSSSSRLLFPERYWVRLVDFYPFDPYPSFGTEMFSVVQTFFTGHTQHILTAGWDFFFPPMADSVRFLMFINMGVQAFGRNNFHFLLFCGIEHISTSLLKVT